MILFFCLQSEHAVIQAKPNGYSCAMLFLSEKKTLDDIIELKNDIIMRLYVTL